MRRFFVQSLGLLVVMALALFIPAGTMNWPAGWVFLALFLGFYLGIELWLLKYNPGLLQERMRFGTSDQKGWDKILFPLVSIFPLVWLGLISFDANRAHWSPVPTWLQAVGAALLLGSFYIFFLTFRENSYLSPVVRLQKDRGHTVVSSGPYHYVRHPMYAGIFVFMVSTSLLLGSWYCILLGLLLVVMLARRAVLEERTLRQELQGYTDYMANVRYRFIPYVW